MFVLVVIAVANIAFVVVARIAVAVVVDRVHGRMYNLYCRMVRTYTFVAANTVGVCCPFLAYYHDRLSDIGCLAALLDGYRACHHYIAALVDPSCFALSAFRPIVVIMPPSRRSPLLPRGLLARPRQLCGLL